jgi:hypothetical protein
MSLQLAAQHLSHQGRGPDDTLVHMSKNELKSLNDLAMAHGGQLTINPQTGLPEAGLLDKLLPTIIGAGITYFSNGAITPMQAGLITGGLETVRSGSLQKGLMAGLGAYGGAGLTSGLMGAGEASIGAGANAALEQQMPGLHTQAFGDQGFGNAALQNPAIAGASNFDKLSGGVSQLFKDPSKVMDSMGGGFNTIKNIGSAASPLLGAEEVKANMPKTTTQPGKIRTYSYNPYGQTYTSTGDYEVPVTAAGGGLMGMNDGYNPSQLDFTQRSEPVVRMADGGTPPPPPPKTVEDLYTSILGRPSDAGGAAFWQQQFGDTLDPNEINAFTQAANVEIANRPAATTAAATTAAAPTTAGQTPPPSAPAAAPISAGIQSLYQDILYRAPDAGGAEYWQKQFGDTVDATERATFAQAAKPEQQVADMYRNVLGRDPDPGGLTYWTTRINKGEPVSNVYNEFLGAARENTEMVTADNTLTKILQQQLRLTPVTGQRIRPTL